MEMDEIEGTPTGLPSALHKRKYNLVKRFVHEPHPNQFFFPQLSLVKTVLLVSLQAYDEYEGQKSRAHAGAYEGGSRLDGGGSAGASARIWLQLG